MAELVLSRPDDVVEWSTAELAEAAGTSTATVIRACQSLGFRGFQHLRLELARVSPIAEDPTPGPDERDEFDSAIDALRDAKQNVSFEVIERAATLLCRARRIVLVGNGFSGPPLQDFAMRLSTLGHSVVAPVDPLAQQFAVNAFDTNDVCFALSYSGANVQTMRACKSAHERGAAVVVVTSYKHSPLGRLADLVISTGAATVAHDVDPYLARLGHTVALHAIHAAIGELDGDAAVDTMRHVVADALSDE